MANRRKFLAGLGALASGSAAAVGTGAFSSASASRDVNVAVAGDADAYLSLDAGDSAHASNDGNTLGLSFTGDEGEATADGLNTDAFTWFNGLFTIKNQGSETVAVWLDDGAGGNPYVNNGASADLIEKLDDAAGVNPYNIFWTFSRDSQPEAYANSKFGYKVYDNDGDPNAQPTTDSGGNTFETGLDDNNYAPVNVETDVFNYSGEHPVVLTPGDEIDINVGFDTSTDVDSSTLVSALNDVEGDVVINAYSEDFADSLQE